MLEKKEREFKILCLKLGFTLLFQFVLQFFFLWNADQIAAFFGYKLNYASESVLNSVIYLACFMLPVLFFRLISMKDTHSGMQLSVNADKSLFLFIPASVAVTLSAAYLNGFIMSFTDYSVVYAETVIDSPAALMLEFMASAIVPAVCEEFLFRGCIESELLPYGKQNAIFFSALVFAAMHGNFPQFMYTFCAGLAIGYVFAETGSIWPGMFIHLFNNLLSVAETALTSNTSVFESELLYALIEASVLAVGALCTVILILKKKLPVRFNDGRTENCFLKTEARYFFNPATIAFIVLNVLEAAYVFVMTLIW